MQKQVRAVHDALASAVLADEALALACTVLAERAVRDGDAAIAAVMREASRHRQISGERMSGEIAAPIEHYPHLLTREARPDVTGMLPDVCLRSAEP